MTAKITDSIKFDFSRMLDIFYVNNVILPMEKIEELHEKKNLNIDRLKNGLEEYNLENGTSYNIEEIIIQGSIAMGTSVSADEKNYDIDIAIVMDKKTLPEGTLAAKRIISESLKKKCRNMKNEPDPTGNSITIEYEEGYHLDFALYGKENNVYYHCGASNWEERNPKSISWWFNNQNQKSNGNLREMVKYIKFFCKQNSDWKMPGGLIISVLVDEVLSNMNLNEASDVLLKDIVNAIIERIKNNKKVSNPTDVNKSLIKKEKDIQKLENLCSRLEIRISKVNQLTSNSDENEINEAWNYFFGDNYFSKDFEFKKNKCENNEENIENYFDINDKVNTKKLITCQLSSLEGATSGRTVRNYESNTPLSVSRFKDEQLIFTANVILQNEITILWKVKNTGSNAIKGNSLRGNILYSNKVDNFYYLDIKGNKRCEHIAFPGHHYVECYVIKNNKVISMERFLVNLVE